jgi:hypothetical protein
MKLNWAPLLIKAIRHGAWFSLLFSDKEDEKSFTGGCHCAYGNGFGSREHSLV